MSRFKAKIHRTSQTGHKNDAAPNHIQKYCTNGFYFAQFSIGTKSYKCRDQILRVGRAMGPSVAARTG